MPLETHLHYDPLGSLLVVFGVNLVVPLLMGLEFVRRGLRGDRDARGAYLELARWTAIVFVGVQVLSIGYHARPLAGTPERGTVTRAEPQASARLSPHCDLTLETAHGSVTIAVADGGCGRVPVGTEVPIVTLFGSTVLAQVEEQATVHVAVLLLGALPLALFVTA